MRLKSSFALALLATIMFAFPAKGHDQLLEIEPASKAVLTDGSFEAKLTFNNTLLVVEGESNAELSIRLAGAVDWVSQEIVVKDSELTSQIDLREAGDYDLRWKVVSSDGHPISGESTFTLELETSQPQESEAPILIAPAPIQESGEGGTMIGFYIGLAMVVLGVIFAPIGLMIRRRARKS